MSIVDLYESPKHRNNLAHFSAIVNMALIDGEINQKEQKLIERFVRKLDITEQEYKEVMKSPKKYPILPQNISDDRLERMLDFFKTIYSDHEIDETEAKLVLRYAIQLGYNEEVAHQLIKKLMKLFTVNFDFDEYKAILKIL